jgi:hypothetical protein
MWDFISSLVEITIPLILENDASQVWIRACQDKKNRRKGRRQIMVKRWKEKFYICLTEML